MTLSQLINRPCTILRRTTNAEKTPYGRQRKTDTLTETVCELQQTQSTELADGGEVADTTFLLVLPAATDIRTGDALVVDGHTYELTGEPWVARNPRTQIDSHIQATVRRVAGTEETGS